MRLANASEKMRRWSMVQTKIGEVWQLCTVSDLYAVAAQFFELLVFAVSASQMCLKPSPRLSPPKAHKWNVQTLNGKLLGTARCTNEQSNMRSLHDRQSPLQSKQILCNMRPRAGAVLLSPAQIHVILTEKSQLTAPKGFAYLTSLCDLCWALPRSEEIPHDFRRTCKSSLDSW